MVDDYLAIMKDKIEIPLSKKKAITALVGSVFFVTFGCFGALKPEDFVSPIFRSPEIIRVSSIAAVVFFVVVTIFLVWKLFDNKPGLIIDEFGITNNTNATSIGLIEWNDITRIEKKQVMSTKFLLLHVNDPEKYIQRTKSIIIKQVIKMNFKTYGTPISITSNSLKISFEALETLITRDFEIRKVK